MSRFRLQLDIQLFSQEKTEAATPKKRQDARKKGQVAKSVEIPAAFILFFSTLTLYLFGGFMKERLMKLFAETFRNQLQMNLTIENVQVIFGNLFVQSLILLSPIFILTVVIAIIGNYLQIGILFTAEPLMMKFSKLNPIEGAKRMFSLRIVTDFLKSTLKMGVIGYVVYSTLMGAKGQLMQLARYPLESTIKYISSITLLLGLKIGFILIVLSIFDFLYQKYEFEKSIKMSKQDIKDEYKKSEGDPMVKGKIKARQRQMAMQRMMQEVPKADVVITNPTHFAIALQYDSSKMQAPTVIAKGADYVALKMKEVAKDKGIIMMENKPLARALYAQVEIGETIPSDLFQAVAEVLAYVYKMKGKTQ